MKKTLIIAFAALIAFAFAFSSCTKDLTKTELLTKKGWVLLSAVSNPAYTNLDEVTSENLFVSFFDACELNDILNFNDNMSSIMELKGNCSWNDGKKEISLGNWRFVGNNEEVLEFHLPYFFAPNGINFAVLEAKVVDLKDGSLILRIPVEFTDDPSAKGPGKILNTRGPKGSKNPLKFDFTLTYKHK